MGSKQINMLIDEEEQKLVADLQARTGLSTTNLTKLSWRLLDEVISRRTKAAPIRSYIGTRTDTITRVLVEEAGHQSDLPPSPIRGYGQTAFDWGYYGQGPDALAQAILAYEFGPAVAEIYGHRFKDQVIAFLPTSSKGKGDGDEEWRLSVVSPF